MGQWQLYAAAAGVTAVGAGAMFVLAARTGQGSYALAGLAGAAMTAGWFLRYVHALVSAHAGPSPTDLVGPSSGTNTERDATDALDGFSDR